MAQTNLKQRPQGQRPGAGSRRTPNKRRSRGWVVSLFWWFVELLGTLVLTLIDGITRRRGPHKRKIRIIVGEVMFAALMLGVLYSSGLVTFVNQVVPVSTWSQVATWPVTRPWKPDGPYDIRLTPFARPSLSPEFIDRVLAAYGSPAAGKGQALYDLSIKYGIDDAYPLAIFDHDSTLGTRGVARVTENMGNVRCVDGYRCYHDPVSGDFANPGDWVKGWELWFKQLQGYLDGSINADTIHKICPCHRIDDVLEVYAPPEENNTPAYIRAVKHAVDTWRSGQVYV